MIPWERAVGSDAESSPGNPIRWSGLALAPDGGFAIIEARGYRVRALTTEGDLVSEFGRPELGPLAKSAEQLERERERAERFGGGEPDPHRPHVGWSAYDGTGRLWLHALREPGLFDVFSPAGEFLGEVRIDGTVTQAFPGFSIAGDRAAAIVYDEAGVARVQIWEIVGD